MAGPTSRLAEAAGLAQHIEQVGGLGLQRGVAVIEHAVDGLLIHRQQQLGDVPGGVVRHPEGGPVAADVEATASWPAGARDAKLPRGPSKRYVYWPLS